MKTGKSARPTKTFQEFAARKPFLPRSIDLYDERIHADGTDRSATL